MSRNDDITNNFKSRLKELRRQYGLSIDDLAKIAGTTSRAMQSYSVGARLPRENVQIKLADHFNVSVEYLMGYTDTNTKENIESKFAGLSEEECNFLLEHRKAGKKTKAIVGAILKAG